MPLIGTAGHVDHGKSSLIQRLTGRDPDRWDEEKRRGLTIDLGFAWTKLPSGEEISFVDVPGHERYLKNMLAGIESIDIALFVVAADEGWMPQSEEHLAVLDLLGVDKAVVALTKVDLVDSDLLELATIEVEEQMAGTSLEGAEIVPVSSTDGTGIESIVESLDRLVKTLQVSDTGRPRLWVDRVFSATGAGTVVTGTLLDGTLNVDDSVELFPSGKTARIRGLQSHESPHQEIGPGRRVAINLGGVGRDDVERGDMVGLPDQWATSSRFLVRLRPTRYTDGFERKGAFHLHLGSSAQGCEILAWDGTYAVIRSERAVPIAVGDPFILRDTGRRLVTAGGWILDPHPGATIAALAGAAQIDPIGRPDEIATQLLVLRGEDFASRLAAHSGGGVPIGARLVGDRFLTEEFFDHVVAAAERLVSDEHATHPLRVGLPTATLAEQLGTAQDVVDAAVDASDRLERIGPDVSVGGREPEMSSDLLNAWEKARDRLEQGLDVPTERELGLDPELLHYLLRTGRLARIGTGLVMLPSQLDRVREILAQMPDEFTVADFRDATELSRKYAVPLLEWADMEGLTVRRGDTRTLR